MPDEFVTRGEYEQFVRLYEVRHAELRVEVKELENKLSAQINNLVPKMDALSAQLEKHSTNAWRLLAVSLLNFGAGGGLIAILNALHVFR